MYYVVDANKRDWFMYLLETKADDKRKAMDEEFAALSFEAKASLEGRKAA